MARSGAYGRTYQLGIDTPILAKGDIVQFEDPYDLPQHVRCGIVGCHQPHKRGYIVLLRDGTLSRVGNVCGKRLLGEYNFVLMQRDLESRRQRELREQYISSAAFDPKGALAALTSWTERVGTIDQFIRDLQQHDINVLEAIQRAVERHHGELEYWDRHGRDAKIRIEHGKFLERAKGPIDRDNGWRTDFDAAKKRISKILEYLSKDGLTDDELKLVLAQIGEAQRKLRVTAEMLDTFDAFCRSTTTKQMMSIFFQGVKLPKPLGPVDRMPINKLNPT